MQAQATAEILGQIENITFHDEDSGFTIARLRVKGKDKPVTVKGVLPIPVPGQELKIQGEWKNDPRYGEQLEIRFCKTQLPSKAAGIEKFLGSGMIKGIGGVMAARIVKKFGENALAIIDKSPERLLEIDGIGDKRVEMIKKGWADNRGIEEVMTFLIGHGVTPNFAYKIYRAYGSESIKMVTENPYRLAWDIDGVGFKTADALAAKMGFSRESPERADAGLLYTINEKAGKEGHVYVPRDILINEACKLLSLDNPSLFRGALNRLELDGTLIIEELPGNGSGAPELAVYTRPFHIAERRSAGFLRDLLCTNRTIRTGIDVDKAIAWAQEKAGLSLSDRQKAAVKLAVENKACIITGGPGTGKSTILSVILNIYDALRARVLLASPTGRAAKRMTETTGREAKTIHRLLESKRGGFARNEKNPLSCDVLVIDEASMIDTMLLYNLLKAVPVTAGVIFIGDINQLPSVGPGAVLRDMIVSGVIPVAELREIFRQAAQSKIITNAHRINAGIKPDRGGVGDDFVFLIREEPQDIVNTIMEVVTKRLPNHGYDPIRDVQVLCPMHKGDVGGINLNEKLQAALNPNGKELKKGHRIFRVGDKVMQIRNNYDKEVHNGDWGIITAIDSETREVQVEMEDRVVPYDFTELDDLVMAFAVSIHKSQGSEYPVVVMPVHYQHYILLQRNLLYTGVTRGRKLVVIVGSDKAMNRAVKNEDAHKRFTRFAERLSKGTGLK